MATVLVVDDRVANRKVVVALLKRNGHRPVEAADGAEALRLARVEHPQLVISDILMPTMDGFEFVRQLRADPELSDTPVIFHTATYREREARALALACGVSRVLTKPCPTSELSAAIEESLHGERRQAPAASPDEADRQNLRVTGAKLAQKVDELTATNKRLDALTDVKLRLASVRHPATLLKSVCREARELIGARYAVICMRDRLQGDAPVCLTSGMGLDPGAAARVGAPRIDDPVFAAAMDEGRAFCLANPGGDPRAVGLPAGYPPVYSSLIAPVGSLSETYGWIGLLNKVGRESFDDEDTRILTSLAAQVGRIYENSLLYREMQSGAEHLRESELRFRELAENISEVFFLTDAAFTRMLYVNPGYEAVWGRSCASLYAAPNSWADLIPEPDRARVLAVLQSLKEGDGFDFEYPITRDDGSRRTVHARGYPIRDAGGKVYRFAGIATDRTEVMRAGDELRESERRYADMMRNLDLIFTMVDIDANILDCNDHLLELTGWERSEVIGRNWFDVFNPPEYPGVRATLSEILRNSPQAWHYENHIVTRAGERLLVRWNNTAIRSPAGEVIGTAAIGEDITERKRAEEEVRRLNADLERSVTDRTTELRAANKELEAFDYSISHDLRAPLNRIAMFGALLEEQFGAQLGEEGGALLQRMMAAAHGMDLLVADLFALSTVTRGELNRSHVDLGELGRSILATLHKAEPERELRVEAQAGMTAHADPGLARAVVENLLVNAWKFTRGRTPAHIELGYRDDPAERVFFVRDNGVGFDMAHAGELFTPFRRMHSSDDYEGTGIGLATVQRIVVRHGGRVWAEAVEGRGATLFFTLAERRKQPKAA